MAKSTKNGANDEIEDVMLFKNEAAEFLSIAPTYVASVADSKPTLAAGVVRDTHPGSNLKRWRISRAACEAYLAEIAGGGARTRSVHGVKRYATVEEISTEQKTQIDAFLATIGLSPLGNVWTRPAKAAKAAATNGTSDHEDESGATTDGDEYVDENNAVSTADNTRW